MFKTGTNSVSKYMSELKSLKGRKRLIVRERGRLYICSIGDFGPDSVCDFSVSFLLFVRKLLFPTGMYISFSLPP